MRTRANISVVGIGHLARAVYYTPHDTYFQVFEVSRSLLDSFYGLLQVKESTPAAGAGDIFGLAGAPASRLQDGECVVAYIALRYRAVVLQPYSVAMAVYEHDAQVGPGFHLQLFGQRLVVLHAQNDRSRTFCGINTSQCRTKLSYGIDVS